MSRIAEYDLPPELTNAGLGSDNNFVLDNQLEVMTPENIAFQHSIAGPFQRVLAFGFDIMITQVGYWTIVAIFAFAVIPLAVTLFGANNFLAEVLAGLSIAMVLVGSFVITWFYGAYMETYYNGRTWGKMVSRQRVLSVDGSAINGTQAALRNFFRAIDLFPVVSPSVFLGATGLTEVYPLPTALVGIVVMCANRSHRRIGDLIAGTMVVVEPVRGSKAMLKFDDPRVARLAELIPIDFVVDHKLASALSSYVERRHFLGEQRVAEIASRLAPTLRHRFGMPSSTNGDLLLCALYQRTFLEESDEGGTVSQSTDEVSITEPLISETSAAPAESNNQEGTDESV